MEEELAITGDSKNEGNPRRSECYFCGKKDNEVAHLIAGSSAMICSECVELCVDMIREHIPEFCTKSVFT